MDIIVYALLALFVLYLIFRFSGLVKAYRPDDTETRPPDQQREETSEQEQTSEQEPAQETERGGEPGTEDSDKPRTGD